MTTKERVVVTGKRIGTFGFATGRLSLVDALGQADTLAVKLGDHYIGRNGLIQYLRLARGAGSTVKVVPNGAFIRMEHGSLGEVELPKWAWLKSDQRDGAKYDAVCIEVVPSKEHYHDNVGARELATALERALVVTESAKELYNDPVSKMCLYGDGRCLRILASDSNRAAEFVLPCPAEGEAFVDREEAKSIMRVLRKASRARIDFRTAAHPHFSGGETKEVQVPLLSVRAGCLKVETVPRAFARHPLGQGIHVVVPDEEVARAYLSAKEAAEILSAAGLVSFNPDIDRNRYVVGELKEGKITFTTPTEGVGLNITLEADTEGTGEFCINTNYLLPVLKSLGHMTVELGVQKDFGAPLTITGDGVYYTVATTVPVELKDRKPKEKTDAAPQPTTRKRAAKDKAA